jgi:hypothetical protein
MSSIEGPYSSERMTDQFCQYETGLMSKSGKRTVVVAIPSDVGIALERLDKITSHGKIKTYLNATGNSSFAI